MGFTPELLGLNGLKINIPFKQKKKVKKNGIIKVPNNGVDIFTNKDEKPFLAGVFGTVLSTGGDFGTITIQPFSDDAIIQYQHCSAISVAANINVAPWTPIGVTGKAAKSDFYIPENRLHVQVYTDGEPQHPKWSKHFLNPERFNTKNPMLGTWLNHYDGPARAGRMVADTYYKIESTEIGAVIRYYRDFTIQGYPFGPLHGILQYDCTIVSYTNEGVNCFFKFKSCVLTPSWISCVGNVDYYGSITLLDKDILAGDTLQAQNGIFAKTETTFPSLKSSKTFKCGDTNVKFNHRTQELIDLREVDKGMINDDSGFIIPETKKSKTDKKLDAPTPKEKLAVAKPGISLFEGRKILLGSEYNIAQEVFTVVPGGSLTWFSAGAPGEMVSITIDRLPNSGGHFHSAGSSSVASVGRVFPSNVVLGPGYPQNVQHIFIAPASSGTIVKTVRIGGSFVKVIHISVLVPGLIPITGANIRLKAPLPEHPSPYWATPSFIAKLNQLADEYHRQRNKFITITDASLEWGGCFDLNQDWTKPHAEHRNGNQADIRSSDMNNGDKNAFQQIAQNVGISVLVESNHWHVRG